MYETPALHLCVFLGVGWEWDGQGTQEGPLLAGCLGGGGCPKHRQAAPGEL